MKIGILISKRTLSSHQFNLIKGLINNDIDVTIINVDTSDLNYSGVKKIKHFLKYKSIYKLFSHVYFKIQTKIELKVLDFLIKDKSYFKKFTIDDLNCSSIVDVKGNYSKSELVVRLSKEDINKIELENLELLLRVNTPGIIKGGILNAAKFGVVSFHHGDNRWNRGSPPAFWEVYLKKPSTGFIIQILNETLDGGTVCFRGNTYTIPTFWQYNYYNIKNESYSYMLSFILKIKKDGFIKSEDAQIFYDKLLFAPQFHEIVKYQFNIVFRIIKKTIDKIFGIDDEWTVHFIKSDYKSLIMSKATKVKNPKGRFFADPFVVSHNNRNIIFVEDYNYKSRKGKISAIELLPKNEYKLLGVAIDEEFHMSYPYVFKYEDELYMMPETAEIKSIRLYKCVDFPLKWKYQYDLVSNVDAVDSTIHYINNKYWLFTNLNYNSSEHNSILECYFADTPLSKTWEPHSNNPVMFENGGRNGGYVLDDNCNVLVSQKYGFDRYGKSLNLKELVSLDKDSFNTKDIINLNPNFDKEMIGLHHLNSNQVYTCFDTLRRRVVKF